MRGDCIAARFRAAGQSSSRVDAQSIAALKRDIAVLGKPPAGTENPKKGSFQPVGLRNGALGIQLLVDDICHAEQVVFIDFA